MRLCIQYFYGIFIQVFVARGETRSFSCRWGKKRPSSISTVLNTLHEKGNATSLVYWHSASEIKWLGKFAITAPDDDEWICAPGVNSTVNHQKHFSGCLTLFLFNFVVFPPFCFLILSSFCFFPIEDPPSPLPSCLKVMLLLHSKRLINQSIKKFFAVKLNQERSCRREKNRLN